MLATFPNPLRPRYVVCCHTAGGLCRHPEMLPQSTKRLEGRETLRGSSRDHSLAKVGGVLTDRANRHDILGKGPGRGPNLGHWTMPNWACLLALAWKARSLARSTAPAV